MRVQPYISLYTLASTPGERETLEKTMDPESLKDFIDLVTFLLTIINFDDQVIFPSLPPQPPKSSITCDTVNSMLTQAPLQY